MSNKSNYFSSNLESSVNSKKNKYFHQDLEPMIKPQKEILFSGNYNLRRHPKNSNSYESPDSSLFLFIPKSLFSFFNTTINA